MSTYEENISPGLLPQRNFSAYNTLVDADAAIVFKQDGQIIYIISTDRFYYWNGSAWTILVSTGITNSAGANVIAKSNGTNLIASHITDDGTTITLSGTNISFSPLSATTVPYLDGSKNLKSSSVTPTELGYLSGVTSAIQTQINSRITNSAGNNVITKSNGTNVVASNISDNGTTITFGGTNVQFSPLTASTVVYLDSSKNLVSSSVTPTELSYLSGVTSSIQTQLGLNTVQSLTQSTNTLTWNVASGQNATVTLTQSVSTFTISNSVAGSYYTIKIVQGGTGSYTLALPSGSKVVGSGVGAVILSTSVGSIDILTAYYDGTNYFWCYGVSYT